ncbi:MAG: hypothetical protein KDD44_13335, partial [Bdellovibrionales bacterium]|nr:hypothetical protein [Bdellovibrionales bacterium]
MRQNQKGQSLSEFIVIVVGIAVVLLVMVRIFGRGVHCEFEYANYLMDEEATLPDECDLPIEGEGEVPTVAAASASSGGPPPGEEVTAVGEEIEGGSDPDPDPTPIIPPSPPATIPVAPPSPPPPPPPPAPPATQPPPPPCPAVNNPQYGGYALDRCLYY